MKKDEKVNLWKPKSSRKPVQNFVKCSGVRTHIFFLFVVHKIVPRYLLVVQVHLSFAAPPNVHCALPIGERN